MKDVRIDVDGSLRCWNCGAKGLLAKRTLRAKILMGGIGSLMTKKKLKCQRCGEYNDAGNGKPYQGPAKRKFRKEYEREMESRNLPIAPEQPELTIGQEIAQLADLRDRGALTDAEFETQKAKLLDNTDD